jgi:hypothetical protein
MLRPQSAVRSLVWIALLSACSETGPKGFLTGTWNGFEVSTSIQLVVDHGQVVSMQIIPAPPSGFSWYCAGLTAADGIDSSVDVPVVDDSVHAVLPNGNWTATIDGKFYQVSATIELRASMLLSGPACAGAVFNPVVFSARRQGE